MLHNRWVGLGIAFHFVLLGLTNVRAETNPDVVKETRRAWIQRRDSMKSFSYVCAVEETKKGSHGLADAHGEPNDSLMPKTPISDEVVRMSTTFSFEKGKLAYRLEGEQWSEITQAKAPYLYRAAFDGSENVTLLHAPIPMGSINHHREPDSGLTAGVHQIAFWLTFDPTAFLQRQGYDCDKMRVVTPGGLVYEGRKCFEVELPRSNHRWLGRIFVDPSRGYLPVRFIQEFDGAVRSDISIGYAKEEKLGWVASTWEQTRYDSPGVASNRSIGSVLKTEFNTKLTQAIFDVQFPVGAQVVEETDMGNRYFIKDPDGSLRPIKEDEYGAIPSRHAL